MADLQDQVEERVSLAAAIAVQYVEAEMQLFEAISKALAKGNDAPMQASARLAEIQQLNKQAEKILRDLETLASDALAQGVTKAWQDGFERASRELAELGESQGISPGAGLAQLLKEALGLLPGITTGALRQVNDIYRQVIAETTPLALTGAATRRQVTTRALQKFAARGITFFDGKGRTWSISSYAEMAARTAMARAANEGHLETLRKQGRDLVVVSRAPYSCRLCDPWEGKVLSQGGAIGDRQEKNVLTGEMVTVHVAGTVAQARAAGLQHPNCRHTFGVYLPGLTKPPPKVEAKGTYKDTQQQRYLERQIRGWKRRAAAAPPGSGERKIANQHLRAYQEQMKEHLDKTGLLRQRDREQVRADETTNPLEHPSLKSKPKPAPEPASPPKQESAAQPTFASRTGVAADDSSKLSRDGRRASSMRDAVRHRSNDEGMRWLRENMPAIPRDEWIRAGRRDEFDAIYRYTGDDYTKINRALRTGRGSEETWRLIESLDSAMTRQQVPEPVIVHRGVDSRYTQAQGVDINSPEEMYSLIGRVLRDKAYMSTSVGARAAFSGMPVKLMVRVPAGHQAINVDGLTAFPGERELLLRRDTTYIIHSVYKVKGEWYIEAEVVPDKWFDEAPDDWEPDAFGDAHTGYDPFITPY